MKKVWIIAVVIIILAGAGLYVIRSGNRQPGATDTGYTLARIERGSIVNSITSTGTLEPVSVVDVGTQVSGIIDKIYVDFNDTVSKGQLIAELDRTFLSGALDEATASRNRAQAQYDLATTEYERNGPLHEKGFLSDQEFTQLKTAYLTQQAALQSADAAVKKARINLQYATITSPITGTVIQRNIEAGQTVAASFSAPTLFIIAEDLRRMQILASVDEADIGGIKQGLEVQFTVQAYPDRKFAGSVEQVRLQPTVSQNVVTYTVVIATENGDGALLPGMTATVDFIIEKAVDVLKIPNAALRFKPAGDSLMKSFVRRRRAAGNAMKQGNSGHPGDSSARGKNRRKREGDEPGAARAVVWLPAAGSDPRPVFIRTGITSGIVSELVKGEGIEEGTEIITGTKAVDKKGKRQVSLLPQPGSRRRR